MRKSVIIASSIAAFALSASLYSASADTTQVYNLSGFDELDMAAFDTAKAKTKNTKKKEVIDDIKDFLDKRDGKNTEIINKFRKYLSHVPDNTKDAN